MNQIPQHKQPVKPDQTFRLGVIFSTKGVVICPQGKLSLSYHQLFSAIAFLILLLTTGMPILSQFLPFPTNQSQEINQNKNTP